MTSGAAGLARSVVVVATSDEPALMRRQAGYLTLAVAEYFRDLGQGRAGADGLGHALCGGAARDRPRGRRAADRQGLYADRVHRVAAPAGAGRPRHGRGHHHRHLHGAGRWRRPQRAGRRRGAGHPRRPHRDGARHRRARALSGHQRAQIGVADHAARRRPGLSCRCIDPRAAGDGDLCRHGGTDPARRLPAGVEPGGGRGDPPARRRWRRSSPRARKKPQVFSKRYQRP